MSYRDAQYPGQEDIGDRQYWSKSDFIENHRHFDKVHFVEVTFRKCDEKHYQSVSNSPGYRRHLEEYAEDCGCTVADVIDFHQS